MPTLPPSFPPVDAALAAIRRTDWQRVAVRLALVAATVAAVAVAVTLWAIRTGRHFWAQHGPAIRAGARTTAARTAAAAAAAWLTLSPVLGRLANRAADAAFHWLSEGRPMPLPLWPVRMVLAAE